MRPPVYSAARRGKFSDVRKREGAIHPGRKVDGARSSPRREAFTLVEMLVAAGVLLLLAALTLPSLVGASERARRAACADHVRHLLAGMHMYGVDNLSRLPGGECDGPNPADEQLPVVSTATHKQLIQYAGNGRLLECPGLLQPFSSQHGWRRPDYGFVLGYNYLGGHRGTPWPVSADCTNWVSPQTVNESGALPLVTDMNDWPAGRGRVFAPHGNHGPVIKAIDSRNRSDEGTSRDIGAAGGNLGLLDGSVLWRKIREMQNHAGSRLPGDDGCVAAW